MSKRFDWIHFYEELATKLLPYQNDRPALVNKIHAVFTDNNMKLPKLESGTTSIDMDPFTVFSLFNRRLTDQNRQTICRGLREAFSVLSAAPEYFDGIPLTDPRNSFFYRYSDDPRRGAHDIDDLWACFSAALSYADNETNETEQKFIAAYDRVRGLKGNRWKLSMGLFWVRPKFFLNLDSRNRWYLEIAENSQTAFAKEIAAMKAVPSGKKYTQLCRECRKIADADERYHDLAGLSYAAWIVSKDANQQEKVEGAEETDTQNAAIGDTGVRPTHYWLYAPGEGACKWEEFYAKGVMGLGWSEIGDYRQYTSRAKMVEAMRDAYDNSASSFKNASLATWQFLHDVQIDDVIFVKQGLKKIIGRGIVGSDYYFQQNDHENDYSSFRKVNWTNRGDWEYSWNRGAVKTLTDVTQYTEQVKILEDLFTDNDSEPTLQQYSLYNETEFLKDVYMSYEDYHDLVTLLTNKKNVILQGAPSVGKTFAAKRLAYSVMGEKNPDRVMMVQFHQSYSYEDFIMGFRPNASGFELKYGVFYDFCKRAQDDDENNPYFFIIDEINRGNLSRIFGELFMLIENDKRGVELRLPYANETFSVPANVRIIGTMNTADRSLAMIDYALRRRFSFFEMAPGFDSDGFKNYQNRLENDKFDKLVSCIKNLNLAISQDESLGEGFRIGHSFFSNFKKDSLTDDALLRVVKYELVPLLKEYWFDEPQKVKEWQGKLESAVK